MKWFFTNGEWQDHKENRILLTLQSLNDNFLGRQRLNHLLTYQKVFFGKLRMPSFVSCYTQVPSTRIGIFLKTVIFFSVFRKIRIHTLRIRIVFARPHENALRTSSMPTAAYSLWWVGRTSWLVWKVKRFGSRKLQRRGENIKVCWGGWLETWSLQPRISDWCYWRLWSRINWRKLASRLPDPQ